MSALTTVAIANLAISRLGVKGKMQSFEENSAEAKACRAWFSFTVDQALSAHDWTFARKKQTLPDSPDEPTGDWAYRYSLPEDCLVVRQLVWPHSEDAQPYELSLSATSSAATLMADVEGAVLTYTARRSLVSAWPSAFISYFTFLLASNMAMELTAKRTLVEGMAELAGRELMAAAGRDSNQEIQRAPRDSEIIRGRN